MILTLVSDRNDTKVMGLPLVSKLLSSAWYPSNHIVKFADDTVGLISNNDKSAHRREVRDLVDWHQVNNLCKKQKDGGGWHTLYLSVNTVSILNK